MTRNLRIGFLPCLAAIFPGLPLRAPGFFVIMGRSLFVASMKRAALDILPA
jgi:hypothetical protein